MGVYHKECDKNLVEFQKVKDGTKKVIQESKELVVEGYQNITQEVQ
jgi:hypothetical protein